MKNKLFNHIKSNNLKRTSFVNEILNVLPVDKKHILNVLSLKEHNTSIITNLKSDNIANIILLNNTNNRSLVIDIDLSSLKVTTSYSINGNTVPKSKESIHLNNDEFLDIRSLLLKVST